MADSVIATTVRFVSLLFGVFSQGSSSLSS